MKPYMFVIDAVPLSSNKTCQDIAGGKVHIWVIADDKETAKIQALEYIAKYFWKATNIEREFEIQQEQLPRLHEDEELLYRKALLYGIAADFLAYPKKPGNPTDPVVYRKLEHF